MRVLVVDDEPTMVRLFQQRFRKELEAGLIYLVFASSGNQALEVAESEGDSLDFILSDVSMPGMSGLTLVKLLREKGFAKPIYLISAYDEESMMEGPLRAGATGYLPKPLDFEKIRRLLTPALQP